MCCKSDVQATHTQKTRIMDIFFVFAIASSLIFTTEVHMHIDVSVLYSHR